MFPDSNVLCPAALPLTFDSLYLSTFQRITAAEVKVDENVAPLDEHRTAFLKGILPTLDWPALVQVSYTVEEASQSFCLLDGALLRRIVFTLSHFYRLLS